MRTTLPHAHRRFSMFVFRIFTATMLSSPVSGLVYTPPNTHENAPPPIGWVIFTQLELKTIDTEASRSLVKDPERCTGLLRLGSSPPPLRSALFSVACIKRLLLWRDDAALPALRGEASALLVFWVCHRGSAICVGR